VNSLVLGAGVQLVVSFALLVWASPSPTCGDRR